MIGKISILAKNMLEKNYLKHIQNQANVTSNYDVELRVLQAAVQTIITKLLTVNNPSINIAICKNLSMFSELFGNTITDTLLEQIMECLRTTDTDFKIEYLNNLSALCEVVDDEKIKSNIIPSIFSLLVDKNEYIVMITLSKINDLIKKNIFNNKSLIDLIKDIIPLLFYPSENIRSYILDIIITIYGIWGAAKSSLHMIPLLEPFLLPDSNLYGYYWTKEVLNVLIKPPVSREELSTIEALKQNEDEDVEAYIYKILLDLINILQN